MTLSPGYLKQYFKGVIAKKLSLVETSAHVSNQHEFNGTVKMRQIFGDDDKTFPTDFLYLDDDVTVKDKDFLTWYDARRNHPTRTEYRMYYPSTDVSNKAKENDSLFICVKQNDSILCIIGEGTARITTLLYWLFNIRPDNKFVLNSSFDTDNDNLEFLVRTILQQIGIEYDEGDESDMLLRNMMNHFGNALPKTKEFSEYARSLVVTDPEQSPDLTLIQWYNMEEKLFFLFEQHIIKERLLKGFGDSDADIDVEDFVQFSLSVLNRRKARAGLSLENHISAILDANHIEYTHTPITENKSKPDFIFPSIDKYKDLSFPSDRLTMLGSKSTCKDRWRQVLSEADRIDRKHLLTLEPAISENQTNEMISKRLQLVVPTPIHSTYSENQQEWLYSVQDFINEVKSKA